MLIIKLACMQVLCLDINLMREPLENYFPFSEHTLSRVNEVAERLSAAMTWQELLTQNNIPDVEIFEPKHAKSIEILDFAPKDYDTTLVYHGAMGDSIDPNLIMHVLPLAMLLDTTRIIAVGNPGRPGQGYGKLRVRDLKQVWGGDLRATVDPTLEYLHNQGLEEVAHVGYSYGGNKVPLAALHASKYGLKVSFGIAIDPSVADEGVRRLGTAFSISAKHLDKYVQAANCPPYAEARKLSGGLLGYGLGLARMSNMAIIHALAHPHFKETMEETLRLKEQSQMKVSLMWGSESEIAPDDLMQDISTRLIKEFGEARVKRTRFPDQQHAMSDDIFFHSATILHAMEQLQA